MAFLSFSQNLEDFRLSRALSNIENGTYVDIGAYDPVHDSVSAHFYERGWRGVNVEPVIEKFQQYALIRPEDLTINNLIGSKTGEGIFYEVENTGLSTMDLGTASKITKYPKITRSIKVITLDELLDLNPNGEIHWMKIDVEGAEEQVLKGWVENKKRPWVILLEATVPSTQVRRTFEDNPVLVNFGYKLAYFDGLNEYFVHNKHLELCESFTLPISVFDQIKTLDYVVPHYVLGENLDRFLKKSQHFQKALSDYYRELKAEEISPINTSNSFINHRGDFSSWTLQQILAHFESTVFEKSEGLINDNLSLGADLAIKNAELEEARSASQLLGADLAIKNAELEEARSASQLLGADLAIKNAELEEARSASQLLIESRIFRVTKPLRRIYFLALKMRQVLNDSSNRRLRFVNWALKRALIKVQLSPRLRLLIFSMLPNSILTKLRVYVKHQLYKEAPYQNSSEVQALSNVLIEVDESPLSKTLFAIWNEK